MSRRPSTFWGVTTTPSRSGSTQTRTFGTPSTVIMQFGQCPEQQSSPRRRWYLNERENTRRPFAKSADPIVSPRKPSTGYSPSLKLTGSLRSISSPGCGGSLMRRRSRAT